MASSRNVEFVYDIAAATEQVNVDPERLVQVLNNLLENAFANTPAGGRVELHASSTDDAVTLEVRDTGAGLSAEDLERVFTPFWRAQNANRSHKGLGLGLAIAEHLVKGHDGTLTARSDGPGKGCVFTVRLPLAARAARRAAQAEPQADGEAEPFKRAR
jgi:signal transduction histidine kinase